MFARSKTVRSVASAVAALAISMSMAGTAEASPGQPAEPLCIAGTPAPVYRSSDFARIYTIPVGNRMRVHKYIYVNGQAWVYGHAYQKPDGWTNFANFNGCVHP